MESVTAAKLGWLKYAAWPMALALLWVVAPPFHVRRTDTPVVSASPPTHAALDVPAYADKFWSEKLLPAGGRAVDAQILLKALQRDAEAAARQYGRRTGLGGSAFYLVRGEGRVASIDRKGVRLELSAGGGTVLLMTGPLFGNALRDATGLNDIGKFSSFEFNALSAELNRIAETRVQPVLLAHAQSGARLRFTGGAEYSDTGEFKIIPIEVAGSP
jgi:predicted lipoprotein